MEVAVTISRGDGTLEHKTRRLIRLRVLNVGEKGMSIILLIILNSNNNSFITQVASMGGVTIGLGGGGLKPSQKF